MPLSVALKLNMIADNRSSDGFGQQVQGLVYKQLLAAQDGTLATEIHDKNEVKDFTVSGLLREQLGGEIVQLLRLTAISEQLCELLPKAVLQAVTSKRRLFLGKHPFHFQFLPQKLVDARLVSCSPSFDDIYRQASHNQQLTLYFNSPTAFSGNDGENLKAALFFNHYLRKWTTFDMQLIDGEYAKQLNTILKEKIVITQQVLKRQNFNKVYEDKKGRRQVEKIHAATGTITFSIKERSKDIRQVINALADFSFFCGTGVNTTLGMGQTIRVG